VIVLAWIGQVLLFFICWRLFHWIVGRSLAQNTTLMADLLINLALAIVLLIVINHVHSAWWLMGIIGGILGVETALMLARSR
jgi:hypothetical protein